MRPHVGELAGDRVPVPVRRLPPVVRDERLHPELRRRRALALENLLVERAVEGIPGRVDASIRGLGRLALLHGRTLLRKRTYPIRRRAHRVRPMLVAEVEPQGHPPVPDRRLGLRKDLECHVKEELPGLLVDDPLRTRHLAHALAPGHRQPAAVAVVDEGANRSAEAELRHLAGTVQRVALLRRLPEIRRAGDRDVERDLHDGRNGRVPFARQREGVRLDAPLVRHCVREPPRWIRALRKGEGDYCSYQWNAHAGRPSLL